MPDPRPMPAADAPAWLTFVMAAACGLIVANLYYAQPLLGLIAESLGIAPASAGLVMTFTQCGYGIGLLLVVPLSDLMENRRLIVGALCCVAVAVVAVGFAPNAGLLFAACAGIGFFAVAAQVIVPFAAHLAPEARRGRAVGNVMSGLLLGIMLARPIASLVADVWGWRTIFRISAATTLLVAVLLRLWLPRRQPVTEASYTALLASMFQLFRETPLLRLRALYHACAFASFSLFWTAVPLYLTKAFGASQTQIALFALAGVAGAIAAPITGRLADRGWSTVATPIAMLLMMFGLALSLLIAPGRPGAVGLLVAAAIVLDMGVSASLLLGQRAIFALGAEIRGRLNGLFMAMFFVGGAIGSSAGAWAFASGAWPRAASIGIAMPAIAFVWLLVRGARLEGRLAPG